MGAARNILVVAVGAFPQCSVKDISVSTRFGQPTPAPPELCAYDADLECSYFRRRPRSVCSQPDPKRYTWMPEDEDFTRMEWPQSVLLFLELPRFYNNYTLI